MILPIVAYGDPVLRKVGTEIDKEYPELDTLIANMKETMYKASGVGLAAPQIGKAIRLFIIDASPFAEDEDLSEEEKEVFKNFNRVFINAKIIEEEGEEHFFQSSVILNESLTVNNNLVSIIVIDDKSAYSLDIQLPPPEYIV